MSLTSVAWAARWFFAWVLATAGLIGLFSPCVGASENIEEIPCKEEAAGVSPGLSLEEFIVRERERLRRTGAVGTVMSPAQDAHGQLIGMDLLRVEDGSPAAAAGLRPRDRIVAWDQTPISGETVEEFAKFHLEMSIGQQVDYLVRSDAGQLREVSLRARQRSGASMDLAVGFLLKRRYGCDAYRTFIESHGLAEKIQPEGGS